MKKKFPEGLDALSGIVHNSPNDKRKGKMMTDTKAALAEAMTERRAFSYHFTGGKMTSGWWAMNQGMARRIK